MFLHGNDFTIIGQFYSTIEKCAIINLFGSGKESGAVKKNPSHSLQFIWMISMSDHPFYVFGLVPLDLLYIHLSENLYLAQPMLKQLS